MALELFNKTIDYKCYLRHIMNGCLATALCINVNIKKESFKISTHLKSLKVYYKYKGIKSSTTKGYLLVDTFTSQKF